MLEELIKEEYKKYLESIFDVDKENKFIESIIDNKRKETNDDELNKNKTVLNNCIVFHFSEGFALVYDETRTKRYNFIDKEGNLISDNWYSDASSFHEGYARVRFGNVPYAGYNFIDKNGNLLLEKNYFRADDFCNGYAIVADLNESKIFEYNILDKRGNFLLKEWTKSTFYNHLDRGYVYEIDQNMYINLLGEKVPDLSPTTFIYSDGYKVLESNNMAYLLDEYNDIIMQAEILMNRLFESDIPNLCWRYLTKESIEKKFLFYEYKIDEMTYKLKYEPIFNYNNFILCKKNTKYYLYDKNNKKYILISNKEIKYGRNYLEFEGKTYFLIDKLIDVTGINVNNSLELKENIDEVLELEEFEDKFLTKEFYEDAMKKIEKSNEDDKKQQMEELKQKLIGKAKQQEELKVKELETLEKELANSLDVFVKKSSNFQNKLQVSKNSNTKIKERISEEMLFIKVDEHLEIRPEFLQSNILRYFDLAFISFDNVKVSGIDLSYTDVNINPQTVYNKDMSNGNYSGLNFTNKNFEGVNTTNSIFNDCIFDFTDNINLNEELNKVKTINKI